MRLLPFLLLATLTPRAALAATQPELAANQQATADVLEAMHEPAIGALPPGDQVFRFIWLRSFHKPYLVQLAKRGDERSLLVKALGRPWSAGPDGVNVGELTLSRQTAISQVAWDRVATMRQGSFWGKRSDDPARERGCDGAMWILEGRSWGAYHIVERWSPAKGGFRDMCLAMLRLAGVDLADEPVY